MLLTYKQAQMKKRIIKELETRGVEVTNNDIDSEIDSTLTFEENISHLEKKYKTGRNMEEVKSE